MKGFCRSDAKCHIKLSRFSFLAGSKVKNTIAVGCSRLPLLWLPCVPAALLYGTKATYFVVSTLLNFQVKKFSAFTEPVDSVSTMSLQPPASTLSQLNPIHTSILNPPRSILMLSSNRNLCLISASASFSLTPRKLHADTRHLPIHNQPNIT